MMMMMNIDDGAKKSEASHLSFDGDTKRLEAFFLFDDDCNILEAVRQSIEIATTSVRSTVPYTVK